MKKKKTKAINTEKLITDLVVFFNKKNWLHAEDFKDMIKSATMEVELPHEEKQ